MPAPTSSRLLPYKNTTFRTMAVDSSHTVLAQEGNTGFFWSNGRKEPRVLHFLGFGSPQPGKWIPHTTNQATDSHFLTFLLNARCAGRGYQHISQRKMPSSLGCNVPPQDGQGCFAAKRNRVRLTKKAYFVASSSVEDKTITLRPYFRAARPLIQPRAGEILLPRPQSPKKYASLQPLVPSNYHRCANKADTAGPPHVVKHGHERYGLVFPSCCLLFVLRRLFKIHPTHFLLRVCHFCNCIDTN